MYSKKLQNYNTKNLIFTDRIFNRYLYYHSIGNEFTDGIMDGMLCW
jgi:hypothetical protein